MKAMLLIFVAVFLAEIGDKTQLATMLFSAEGKVSPLRVFLASATALVLAAAIGVAAGQFIERFVSPQTLKLVAGIGFIAIGAFTLFNAFKATP
ncbi:MAG: TMEM165/GDT1 family protein [Luteimonas sp.]